MESFGFGFDLGATGSDEAAPRMPSWVPFADGIPAELAINGSVGQAWINKGVQSLHSILTVTRASTRYVRSTSGLWSSVSNNVLGLHTPVGGTQGIIAEEERTNSTPNNSGQGGVAGTPGTWPTNWGADALPSGLTSTLSNFTTTNGVDTFDLTVSGTPGSTATWHILTVGAGVAAATNGQAWTNSWFLQLVSGSMTNAPPKLGIGLFSSAPALLQTDYGSALTLTSTLDRFAQTTTLANASVASLRQILAFDFTSGQAVSFTIRIGWPQLELGAFATTPIRTTGSAATRAAETPYLTLPEGQLGLSAYTLFTKHRWPDVVDASKFPSIAALRQSGADNSQNSIESFDFSGPNSVGNIVRAANVSQLDRTQTATANTTVKAAVSTQANSHLVSVNGVALTPTSTGSPPTGIDRLNIGHNGPADVLNSTIELIAIWGSARSTGALDALTA